jgi:hypothetical protein
MTGSSRTQRSIIILTTLILVATGFACASRYRVDLFMINGDESNKIDVEGTEYVTDAVITDPFATDKLTRGEGSVMILKTGMRGQQRNPNLEDYLILSFDEYVRSLVYLQLPETVEVGSYDLVDKSFVQFLGRYEQPTEQKIFLAESGTLVVDSIVGKRLFGTMDCAYRSKVDTRLQLRGRMKIKVSR